MSKLSDLLDQLDGDNHVLTLRLLERIYSFYRVPRLRKRLIKLPFKKHGLADSCFAEKDLAYLLSALVVLSGCDIDQIVPNNYLGELSRYLRSCQNLGLSVQHFLKGTTRNWQEIRPKFQELSQWESFDALQRDFPKLKAKLASDVTAYLLGQNLLRVFPAYPFHSRQSRVPVVLVRAQPDMTWGLADQSPSGWTTTLCNHFPEFDWNRSTCEPRSVCFLGVRVLSRLTAKTARILRRSLAGLSHLATTRITNKRKILILAFYSQADLNLFKFNLVHYSKLYGSLHEFVNADLSDYRKGCPGFSGFFDEKTLEELSPICASN